jgi:hypothetical protein
MLKFKHSFLLKICLIVTDGKGNQFYSQVEHHTELSGYIADRLGTLVL